MDKKGNKKFWKELTTQIQVHILKTMFQYSTSNDTSFILITEVFMVTMLVLLIEAQSP